MEQAPNYFDIFKGTNGQWYWNLHNGGNHAIISTGGEGFESYSNAVRAVKNFREDVEHAYLPIENTSASMATDDIINDIDEDTPDLNDHEEPREPLERDVD